MKNILLLGASGYIGRMFSKVLEQRSYNVRCLSRAYVDYTNFKDLSNYLDVNHLNFTKTCIVINCAGYTGKPNVDACENEKEIISIELTNDIVPIPKEINFNDKNKGLALSKNISVYLEILSCLIKINIKSVRKNIGDLWVISC